jgi:hypothetical protein
MIVSTKIAITGARRFFDAARLKKRGRNFFDLCQSSAEKRSYE